MDASNLIKITFGGDIMSLKEQNEAVLRKHHRYDYSEYLSEVKSLLETSDYSIANLETPICDSKPYTDSDYIFNTPSSLLDSIKEAGFDFLSTANNHCLDRGYEGIRETIEALDRKGLEHSGTFIDSNEENRFSLINIKGVTFALICFTYGTNSEHNGVMLDNTQMGGVNICKKQSKPRKFMFDPASLSKVSDYKFCSDDVSPAAIQNPANIELLERICNQIKKAKEQSDVVIALPHIGGQFNPAPGLYTRYVIDKVKDAGADMIICSHPHTTLRCETYNSGHSICAYSLGNLCFTPNVGWYLPNSLADYGILLHLFWDCKTKLFVKATFDVIKSVVGEDGIARVIPTKDLYENESNSSKREYLLVENEAVVNRFRGGAESVLPELDYVL
ncbi:MAG: CapA family protein [Prevotella sp.]